MSFNFGYKQGRKMSKEMGGSGKVAVKSHVRSPRAVIVKKMADGGDVKKSSDGSFLDKKRPWITDDRKPGENLSIREAGREVKNAAKDIYKSSKELVTGKKDDGYSRGGKVKPMKGKK